MEYLPSEIILSILSCRALTSPGPIVVLTRLVLNPIEITSLRGISKRLYKLINDNELWRRICFEQFISRHNQKRSPVGLFQNHPQIQEFRRRAEAALSAQQAWVDATATGSNNAAASDVDPREPQPLETPISSNHVEVEARERARRLANWDPTYHNESIDWYAEYIARYAKLSCNWFQPALVSDSRPNGSTIEVKGLALFGSEHVVAPLEDDSFGIWYTGHQDIDRQGRLIHKSKPGLLSIGKGDKAGVSPTIVSAVTVDNTRGKGYVVVQDHIQEIDLKTLQLSSSQQLPAKIAALSDFTDHLPLTVGTKSAVHLYDPRTKVRREQIGASESLDLMSTYPEVKANGNSLSILTTGNFDRFASLHQVGPTAIQHLFRNSTDCTSSDIVVCGRFPSLLVYDRRCFPRLKTTLYSGAQLCGLAALPHGYSSVDSEIMRRGELTMNAAQEAKSRSGYTLFACGEYSGKGSLEIYGLSDDDITVQTSTFKNRVSAAQAKMLSIANHGTRLVVSDATGAVHWIERDGQTLVRRWNINQYEQYGNQWRPSGAEVALKVLPMAQTQSSKAYEDGVLFWTGERIGLMSFLPQARFGGNNGSDWEQILDDGVDSIRRREEKIYGETMKRALERSADEVRWMSGLGLGS